MSMTSPEKERLLRRIAVKLGATIYDDDYSICVNFGSSVDNAQLFREIAECFDMAYKTTDAVVELNYG